MQQLTARAFEPHALQYGDLFEHNRVGGQEAVTDQDARGDEYDGRDHG
jgi:hypothetical protein